MSAVDSFVDRVDQWVLQHTGVVVLAFLVLTGVFVVGLGNVTTESGTDEFTTDLPAQEAFEDIDREFSEPFSVGTASTTLIQREQNVLAKPSLLRMLRTQKALEDRSNLRVSGTSSVARQVATELDPQARTLEDQIDAVEAASPAQIDRAVQRAAARPGFSSSLSNDFNAESATASATIGSVTHRVPGPGAGGPTGAGDMVTGIQLESQHVVETTAGSHVIVFGSGIINDEFSRVIFDSLLIVVPAAALLILLFLTIAYRDPVDLLLGVVALVMAIIWTFGFTGLVGIPFSQMLVAVPPLLLAVGIDFGIHSINRYREELALGADRDPAMAVTLRQLLVAFFIVTGTTVIGFSANGTSSLAPIRDFGMVAAVGITFTFVIFGVFLPAAKLWSDRRRDRYGVPTFSERPIGSKDSLLGRVLPVGVSIAKRAPAVFLVAVLLLSVGAGVYATGISTSFQQEDFLPPEETPAYLDRLPEPFAPGEYTVTGQLNFLEDNFEAGNQQSVTVYVTGPMERDHALEAMWRAGRDPPDEFVASDRRADSRSLVTVIQSYQSQDPEFARLVARNDRNGNGIPDQNLDEIYDYLESSPAAGQVDNFLADDHRSAQVIYTAKGDVGQDELTRAGSAVADRHDRQGYDATATGQTIVFEAVSDTILESAVTSLAIALGLTAVFLVFIYRLITGYASLGLVNLVPIVVTVAMLAGTMRLLGIPFNALTATILSVTIGLGIDYSVHVVHRFADEYEERELMDSLDRTVRGTGGALTGSMLTTVTGIGVLVLAITPILGQFGVLTGLSILYAYLASLLVTPSAIVVWERLRGGGFSLSLPRLTSDAGAEA